MLTLDQEQLEYYREQSLDALKDHLKRCRCRIPVATPSGMEQGRLCDNCIGTQVLLEIYG